MDSIRQYAAKMTGGHAIPESPNLSVIIPCGIGAALAIAITAVITQITDAPVLMAPFGASCFLAFALPDSPLAQPRNIVFGHLISTAVGLVALSLFGNEWWSMAIAVGLAVVLMQVTRTGHAPAGADPLVVIATEPAWHFLFTPVLTGAVIIALVAVVFNNLRPGVRYPKYW